jgi:UDP-GlcNAc:undecaprenyl-phosphate/decaprenyl-phosphate GlcNAc-1-phosphate transferase
VISPFVAAAIATVTAAALVPVARRFALRVGAVDAPEPGRHVHEQATPRLGGLAIFTAYVFALGACALLGLLGERAQGWDVVWAFLAGATIILVVGAIDDVYALGAKKKLFAQIVAATCAWLGGARIATGFEIPLVGNVFIGTPVAYIVTVLWIVAFINAINLIDGLDGLAGGVVFFAAATNVVVAVVSGDVLGATLNAALGGAVLGFLFFNFNPASIFMGDAGSMFLGYALGAGALFSLKGKASVLVSLLIPLIALGLPLADTLLTMTRRIVARRPVFAADRQHLHHRLLALGLTHRRTVLVLYACSVVLCLAALGIAFGRDWQVGLALGGAVLTLVGVARFAGGFQVALRDRRERAELFSGATGALRESLPQLFIRLHGARTSTEIFESLEVSLLDAGFDYAEYDPANICELSWSWRVPNDGRRDGKLHNVVFPVATRSPGESGKLRFGRYLEESESVREFEMMVRLVADAVKRALDHTADGGADIEAPPEESWIVRRKGPGAVEREEPTKERRR